MDNREYYNILAERFKQNKGMEKSIKRQIRLAISNFCSYVSDKNARILDAGCHEGHALRRLRQVGYTKAEGVDYLQTLVRAAQRKGCRAQEGDVHNLYMYNDSVFDAIFSRYMLEHCHTASRAMFELTRILKPGGILFMVVSSEIGGIQTKQGPTVFKTIEDFSLIIPKGVENLSLKTIKTDMGWYDIVLIAKKKD